MIALSVTPNSKQKLKTSSGARLLAGTTSTRDVSSSGPKVRAGRKFAVSTGESSDKLYQMIKNPYTTCIRSRTPWQGDPMSLARIKTAERVNEEGYVNVADQLGLSGERGKPP